MVLVDVADVAEDDSDPVGAGSSVCSGAGSPGRPLGFVGSAKAMVGFLFSDSASSRSRALVKVLRAVGDVVDNVSSLRLVLPFPRSVGTLEVFSDSLGRFDGKGPAC